MADGTLNAVFGRLTTHFSQFLRALENNATRSNLERLLTSAQLNELNDFRREFITLSQRIIETFATLGSLCSIITQSSPNISSVRQELEQIRIDNIASKSVELINKSANLFAIIQTAAGPAFADCFMRSSTAACAVVAGIIAAVITLGVACSVGTVLVATASCAAGAAGVSALVEYKLEQSADANLKASIKAFQDRLRSMRTRLFGVDVGKKVAQNTLSEERAALDQFARLAQECAQVVGQGEELETHALRIPDLRWAPPPKAGNAGWCVII